MATCILVIDDNPAILETYGEILDLEGYICIPRSTPFIGVEEVAQLAPSLLITDRFLGTTPQTVLSLPTIQLVTRLRQSLTTAHIPLLVCSAAGPLLHTH